LKFKSLFFEFFRYVLVGGSAFVLDMGTMWVFNEFIFHGEFLYISVFLGYIIGLIYNFVLSCGFVFKDGFSKIKNKELYALLVFTVIGLIGLGLTEVLMYLFVDVLNIYYLLSKIVTGALVMFWNYIARKIIIFR